MKAFANLVRSAVIASMILAIGSVESWAAGDLVRTWQKAWFAYPKGGKTKRLTKNALERLGKSARKYPVVVYLHGCTGLGKGEREFGELLAREGFVFVAPDSMARSYRPLQCDPKTQTGGRNLFVFDFRMAEIAFALNRLTGQPWVDTGNLFLIGGSEGGVAAALYRGEEFRARVIFQWTCHGSPLVNGIDAPLDEPILAIVNRGDPWYDAEHTPAQAGHCGVFFGDRVGSESLLLDRPGIHDVLGLEEVQTKIAHFLKGFLEPEHAE